RQQPVEFSQRRRHLLRRYPHPRQCPPMPHYLRKERIERCAARRPARRDRQDRRRRPRAEPAQPDRHPAVQPLHDRRHRPQHPPPPPAPSARQAPEPPAQATEGLAFLRVSASPRQKLRFSRLYCPPRPLSTRAMSANPFFSAAAAGDTPSRFFAFTSAPRWTSR